MKKSSLSIAFLALSAIANAQSYPFLGLSCEPTPGSATRCSLPIIKCHDDPPYAPLNTFQSLNYNVNYTLTNKFNPTLPSPTVGDFQFKNNRCSAIDYFKDPNSGCDLYLAVVNTRGNLLTNNGICVLTALSANMNIQWEVELEIMDPINPTSPTPIDIFPNDVYVNKASEIYVCGKVAAKRPSSTNIASDFAAKFDKNGGLLWIKYYVNLLTSPQDEGPNAIVDDEYGHVLMVGSSEFAGTSPTTIKPYTVFIDANSGNHLDVTAINIRGAYQDVIAVGNGRFVAVGSAQINGVSGSSSYDVICSWWELSGTSPSLVLKTNYLLGQDITNRGDVVNEGAWSVVQLGNSIMVAAERRVRPSQGLTSNSTTLIYKLDVLKLKTPSPGTPILDVKIIQHSDNYNLIPVKLIVPPSHPSKISDHFSIILNKYHDNNTSSASGGVRTEPIFGPTFFSTYSIKADGFYVFELDDNLNEIPSGKFNSFLGKGIEPMDASATNNYYENIAILSLNNSDDDKYNIFVRSPLDDYNKLCNSDCLPEPEECSNQIGNLYEKCLSAKTYEPDFKLSLLFESGASPTTFLHNVTLASRTSNIQKCSTICNLSIAPLIKNEEPTRGSVQMINNLSDFKNIIEAKSQSNSNTANKHLLITDIVGRIVYNKAIHTYEELNQVINGLNANSVFVIQLNIDGVIYTHKLLK